MKALVAALRRMPPIAAIAGMIALTGHMELLPFAAAIWVTAAACEHMLSHQETASLRRQKADAEAALTFVKDMSEDGEAVRIDPTPPPPPRPFGSAPVSTPPARHAGTIYFSTSAATVAEADGVRETPASPLPIPIAEPDVAEQGKRRVSVWLGHIRQSVLIFVGLAWASWKYYRGDAEPRHRSDVVSNATHHEARHAKPDAHIQLADPPVSAVPLRMLSPRWRDVAPPEPIPFPDLDVQPEYEEVAA